MSVMFLLIILSILFASGFLAAFLWAVRSGQFKDSYTPSVRMLFDDKKTPEQNGDQASVQTDHRENN